MYYEEEYELDIEDLLQRIGEAKADDEDKIVADYVIRKDILQEALEQGKTLSEVTAELQAKKLRKLYVRNPYELIIYFCLYSNEFGRKKYKFKEYETLVTELIGAGAYLQNPLRRYIKQSAKKVTKGVITLGSIKKYLLENRDFEKKEEVIPPQITLEIYEDLKSFDISAEDTEEKFKEFFKERQFMLSKYMESARFFISKIAYYVVCHKILELREELCKYSSMTPEMCTAYLRDSELEMYNNWALKERALVSDIYEEIVAGKVTQASKAILSSLIKAFPLTGSSVNEERKGSILYSKPLSKAFGESTVIFMNGKKGAEHKRTVDEIKNMTIEDFIPYAIDLKKLSFYMFDCFYGKQIEETTSSKREFLESLLEGEGDISRPGLLLLFSSAKGLLFNKDFVKEIADSIGDSVEEIDLDYVNARLTRLGFVMLGDDKSMGLSYENFYYKLFTEEAFPLMEVSTELNDYYDEFGSFPMPMELQEVHALEKMKGRK